VSTDEQAKAGSTSLDYQETKGRGWADLHDVEVGTVYVEDFTGTKPLGERPEGRRLLAAAAAGEFNVVVFLRLDRLGRNARDILNGMHSLDEFGAACVFVEDNIDTSTNAGKLLRTTLAGVAEFERDSIIDRTQGGKFRKTKTQGTWPGGNVLFGYAVADDRKSFELREDEAAIVRQTYDLRLLGLSVPQIAARLNANGLHARGRKGEAARFTASRVLSLLRHPAYNGSGITRDMKDPSTENVEHFTWEAPALVTPEEWERANVTMVDRMPKNAGKKKRYFALSERVRHMHPDGELVSMSGGGRKDRRGIDRRYYQCKEGLKSQETGEPPSCPGFGEVQRGVTTTKVNADRIEAIVLWRLLGMAYNEGELEAWVDGTDAKLAALAGDDNPSDVSARLSRCEMRLVAIADNYEEGLYGSIGSSEAVERRAMKIAAVKEEQESLTLALGRAESADERRTQILYTAGLLRGAVKATRMDSNLVEQILGGSVATVVAGRPPRDRNADELPERGSRQWMYELAEAVRTALLPGKWGRTAPLARWAAEECHLLANGLGASVTVSGNIGCDDPSKLPGWLTEDNRAEWPIVELGIDPSLPGVRARLDSSTFKSRIKIESSSGRRSRRSSRSSFL